MKNAKSTQQSQAARFLEAARKTAAGKPGKEFEQVLGKVAQSRLSRKATRLG
jgi:hypothetical protein